MLSHAQIRLDSHNQALEPSSTSTTFALHFQLHFQCGLMHLSLAFQQVHSRSHTTPPKPKMFKGAGQLLQYYYSH